MALLAGLQLWLPRLDPFLEELRALGCCPVSSPSPDLSLPWTSRMCCLSILNLVFASGQTGEWMCIHYFKST